MTRRTATILDEARERERLKRAAMKPATNGTHAAPPKPKRTLGVELVRMADIDAEPIDWLWRDRIPRGAVTLAEGDPGKGKTTVALDILARVSRGWAMPPGGGPEPGRAPADAVVMTAEDSLAQTVRPRLEAAGADLSRVHAITSVRTGDDDADVRPPVLPHDLAAVEEAARRVGAVLVVIDPFMAYLDAEVNSHRDQDVRRVLHQLKLMAERLNAAVLVIRHLNKMAGGSAMYRGGGSIGIIGAARSALLVAADPGDDKAVVLASVKSNLGAPPRSLRYRVEPANVGGIDVGRIAWLGECDLTANDLNAKPEMRPAKSKGDQCADAIREALAGGPLPVEELDELLDRAGFGDPARRAGKRAAGVRSRREGFGSEGRNIAYLPEPGDDGW